VVICKQSTSQRSSELVGVIFMLKSTTSPLDAWYVWPCVRSTTCSAVELSGSFQGRDTEVTWWEGYAARRIWVRSPQRGNLVFDGRGLSEHTMVSPQTGTKTHKVKVNCGILPWSGDGVLISLRALSPYITPMNSITHGQCMMPDLRLPSQPQSVAAHWQV